MIISVMFNKFCILCTLNLRKAIHSFVWPASESRAGVFSRNFLASGMMITSVYSHTPQITTNRPMGAVQWK